MLHPKLAEALATAYIEELHREAARWRTIHVARRARPTRGSRSAFPEGTRASITCSRSSAAAAQPSHPSV